jgi:hypothetical protein
MVLALAVIAFASLPFIANGRVGFLGQGFLDDLGGHVPWTEGLRTDDPLLTANIFPDYPLGAHSLAATVATLARTNALPAFTAVMLVVPALTSITALAALAGMPRVARAVVAGLVGLPYLAAAQLAWGAFKEPIVALSLLAFTLLLRELRNRDPNSRAGIALGVLIAGAVLVNGATTAAWFLAITVFWATAEVIGAPQREVWSRARRAAPVALVAVATAVVTTLPEVVHLARFSPNRELGFVQDIPLREVFGVWLRPYMAKISPYMTARSVDDGALAEAAAWFAAAVAVAGAIWWARRRDVAVPAAALAALALALVVREVANGYLAAKALATGAPLIILTAGGAICWAASRRSVAGLLAMSLFALLALWSSALVLVNANVGSNERAADLEAIRRIVDGSPTLFLGEDHFVYWKLRGARIAAPNLQSLVPFALRPQKPFTTGSLVDFDSIDPSTIDVFSYVVATRSHFASRPPPSWRAVLSTRYYTLWRRRGATPEHKILSESGTTGAAADCSAQTPNLPQAGRATVTTPPVIGPPVAWQTRSGRPSTDGFGVPAGSTVAQSLALSAGLWDISLQYYSPVRLRVTIGGRAVELPPSLDVLGPYWEVGRVRTAAKALDVAVSPATPRLPLSDRAAFLGAVAAARVETPQVVTPARAACGRFVDWFTTD